MCKVSDKIKFCTCGSVTKNTRKLKNYWVLNRLKTDGFEFVVGSFMLPNELSENFEINKKTILKRLKESDAFDIPISFQNDDTLVIYLNQNKKQEMDGIIYSFEYQKGKWKYDQYNPLYLGGSFNEVKSGKFENLWDRKNKNNLNY